MMVWTVSSVLFAQSENEWVRYYNEIITIDNVENEDWENTYNTLCEMAEHPIDLNHATPEDLEQLLFLTARQIEDISEYIYMYGGLKTFAELKMIPSLDGPRSKLLQFFTFLGDDEEKSFPSVGNIAKYGKHELMATAKVPFYTRKGEDEGKYLGDKYKHSLRYTFNFGDYLKVGLAGSKDAGEPFFKNGNGCGYDYYSAYLQMKRLGKLDVLVVGDYKMVFGMGLVANSSFNLGKLSAITNLGRTTNNISGSVSSYGLNRFRGAAATLRICKPLTLTAFFSHRKVDGTIASDSVSISSIVASGYHRTESEMAKKHNTELTDAGANINFRSNGFHLGLTALYSHLNRELQPNKSYLYRTYYPAGYDFLNVGMNYGYDHYRVTVNGETAMDKDGHVATVNSVSANVTDNLSAMLLQRFYSYRYSSLHADSYAEGGRVQNESGIYAGINWQCLRHITVTAYTDYSYFAWPKLQASFSSHCWDNLVQGVCAGNSWSLSMRYRLRKKERDNSEKTALTDCTEQRARVIFSLKPAETLEMKTQVDMANVNYLQTDKGYAVSQMITLSSPDKVDNTFKYSCHASFTYFNSDGYNSRLYVYERGPLYSFYVPSFYGEGIRYTLMFRANVHSRLTLTAKLGVTDYFDRAAIGSGNQMIDGSSQADLDLQVRWKF